MKSIPAALPLLLAVAACGAEPELQDPRPLTDLATVFPYPVELWDEGHEGQTILMVHVTEMGDVDSTYVTRTSGFAAFDSAALAGIRDVRFAPGRRGDERVDAWVRLPVRFRREVPGGAAATATGARAAIGGSAAAAGAVP